MQMATRMAAASNHMSKMIVAVVVSFFGEFQSKCFSVEWDRDEVSEDD